MKLTQQRIEDLLDTAVLQRAVFHGQHAAGSLLEATDKSRSVRRRKSGGSQ
eukprot:jgi/Mesen1/176/ME1134399C07673